MATELVAWMDRQEKIHNGPQYESDSNQPEPFILDKLPLKKHSFGPDHNRSAPMTTRGNLAFTFENQYFMAEKKRKASLLSQHYRGSLKKQARL